MSQKGKLRYSNNSCETPRRLLCWHLLYCGHAARAIRSLPDFFYHASSHGKHPTTLGIFTKHALNTRYDLVHRYVPFCLDKSYGISRCISMTFTLIVPIIPSISCNLPQYIPQSVCYTRWPFKTIGKFVYNL